MGAIGVEIRGQRFVFERYDLLFLAGEVKDAPLYHARDAGESRFAS
jgi:hypothetical protein